MTLPRFAAERRRLQHGARSYRPIFPGHRTLDSKPPAAVSAVDRWDRQTDGRTDVQQLHRPCSPYYKTFKTTAKTSAACCVAWRCEQADGWTGIEEELKLAGFVEFAGVFWHTRGSTAPGAESGICLVLAGRRVDGHRGGAGTGRIRRGRSSLLGVRSRARQLRLHADRRRHHPPQHRPRHQQVQGISNMNWLFTPHHCSQQWRIRELAVVDDPSSLPVLFLPCPHSLTCPFVPRYSPLNPAVGSGEAL